MLSTAEERGKHPGSDFFRVRSFVHVGTRRDCKPFTSSKNRNKAAREAGEHICACVGSYPCGKVLRIKEQMP